MRCWKPRCGGTELESHLTLPGCFTCIHARKKRGLPPALNGEADSDLQVSGGLGGRGRGQGALMQSLRKERDWLSKSFFLALWASVRPKNKEGAWTLPLVPPTICV